MEKMKSHFLTTESSVVNVPELDEELNRLITHIEERFAGKGNDVKRLTNLVIRIRSHTPRLSQDSQTNWQSLRKGMKQPAIFDQAMASMPPCKVIIFAQFVKLRLFELADIMACLILQGSKSTEERREGAQSLLALLKQAKPLRYVKRDRTLEYERAVDYLKGIGFRSFEDDGIVDCLKGIADLSFKDDRMVEGMLLDTVKTGEVPELRWPAAIDEAFRKGDWSITEKLYKEHRDKPLSKGHLNKMILLAAFNSKWDVFLDCARRGAELIKSVKPEDISEEAEAPKQFPKNTTTEMTARLSPLHEILSRGEFPLQELEGLFPDELVNATDECGNTLLRLVVSGRSKKNRIDNIKFLMKHKADVNTSDEKGSTVIECMVRQGGVICDGNALAELVMEAEFIGPRCWRPANNWSALHVLCSQGLHQYIVPFVEKGANQFELRHKLTLIDTLVLKEGLHYTVKETMLAALLDERLSLGPFHARVVQERPQHEENMEYKNHIIRGDYLYPTERLLFPVISTHWLRKANLKLVQMLVDAGAVCKQELQALGPRLASLKDDNLPEVEEYLRTQIENLSPPSHQPEICGPLEEIEVADMEY